MKFTALLSLAAAVCVVSAANTTDPCAALANEATAKAITLDTTRACYNSFKFDKEIAAKTIESLENLWTNFYPFIDSAQQHSGSPFVTPKVNLLAELKKIKEHKWKNDYEFHNALHLLVASLNDGHASYSPGCYQSVLIRQPISLYAPVIDGRQDVRVFSASSSFPGVPANDITDCVVSHIDGKPAFQTIQEFADLTSGISKDPSVRLADTLAATLWQGDWFATVGGFSARTDVPKKNSMKYTIQCPKQKVQKIDVPYYSQPRFNAGAFTDSKSYWKNLCSASPPASKKTNGDHKLRGINGDKLAPATETLLARGVEKIGGSSHGPKDGTGSAPAPAIISHATQVSSTANALFYILNNTKTKTGVIVLNSEEPSQTGYQDFINGLTALQKAGAKKIILDVTFNGGGSVDYAYFLNSLFFPTAEPYFVMDIRSNKYVQGAAKIASAHANFGSLFDARNYENEKTHKPFTDSSMFTKPVTMTRAGRKDTYSQKNYFPYGPWPKASAFPWKASDLSIVSNGWCGSACTMVVSRFNIVHKVKTYVIGGYHKRPMSYFSFPGGFVMDNTDLVSEIQALNYTAKGAPSNLPTSADARIPVGEIYASVKTNTPLEYDPKFFPAQVHLDFDAQTARHPDLVWLKIAADFK
ncbi:hypothetical protein EMPS_05940 [Entomortierella parvispora]|uniref:Tail specific protease domain-containing protein n=1 Tax=Entomortierella parvispora TaxID=205924 RepID=A0A9P3LWZ7_9FUNG|nr:hypothetical protein EMPS_05940 [Entomortierella parvispora]